MPATAKRGFRLPWMRDDAGDDAVATQVLDGRPGDAPSPQLDPAADPEADGVDDLGSGPFGIAPPAPPRAAPPLSDPDEVVDLELRTSPDPDRADGRDADPGGELPKWLRQAPADASDRAAAAGPTASDLPDARPGINAVSSVEPTPSNGAAPPAAASASAWPQADFASRAAASQAAGRAEAEPDQDPGAPPADEIVAADQGAMARLAELAQPGVDAVVAAGDAPPADATGLRPDGAALAGNAASGPAFVQWADRSDATNEPLPADFQPPAPGVTTGGRAGQRAGSARSVTTAAAPQASHDRRDNPLLTGLVKAMRDSARTTREETTARLRVEAEARVAVIRARAAADAVALRTQTDEDVNAIREWSKAEMARIRVETAERIESRRSQLATDSHALSSLTSRLVTEIEGAVGSFETEMKRFFKAFLAEEDPAQLATLAERMPEPPVLESLPEAVAVGIDHVSSGSRSRATRAAANPAKGAKRPARPATPKSAEGAGAGAGRSSRRPAGAARVAGGDAAGRTARTPDATALDPEAAALAEAEALAGLDLSAMTGGEWNVAGVRPSSNGTAPHDGGETSEQETAEPDEGSTEPESAPSPADDAFMIESQTRLIVVGLGDPGVSAFERALHGVAGVGSVNVSPGGDGEVVFSVTHGADTDLRAAVPELPGFRAHVTGDEGAILSVAAQDPS